MIADIKGDVPVPMFLNRDAPPAKYLMPRAPAEALAVGKHA